MDDIKYLERILTGNVEPRDLALQLLQEITEKFSDTRQIGVGGFGVVYKGELQNGISVAVKRIIVTDQNLDDADFNREVKNLMKIISRRNVVRFLGFCSNTHCEPIKPAGSTELVLAQIRERLLCFEYISNGNLGKHITDELRGLDWSTRYDIINGVCHGLHYLHEEKNIIHMDLNPSNIMLDNDMVPKITDFGLSRPDKNTHISGAIFVTRGYCAPEYVENGKTSKKADIYSLGVIIVELITGGKVSPSNIHNVLRRWRHRWSKAQTLLNYQEHRPAKRIKKIDQEHQITRCMEVAIRCRKTDPKDRPSIGHILDAFWEMERDKVHIGQESTYPDDGMLDIDPLELKLNKELSWSVTLTNKTKAYFAFHIERPSKEYTIRPHKGIVAPGCSECLVQITVKAQQVTQNVDKFVVRSTKVSEGLRVDEITQHIFHEEVGKVVDEVDLMVADELVKAVYPKAIDSSSYKDGARGKLDRHNFLPLQNFSHSQPTNMTYLLEVSDRAMDVTRGAIGSLLHKLGELRKEEFNLETSVKEDLDLLSNELVKMQSILRKVSMVHKDNLDNQVKLWASNVREMSYDLEDFVDDFLLCNELDSNMTGFRELTHELCFLLDKGKSHHTICGLIKDKRKQVQDAATMCKEFKVDSVVPNASIKDAIVEFRNSAMYTHKQELVGIETPRDEIIRLFADGDVSKKNLEIVSIVGLGGLGKTTLAKEVYDKLKVQFSLKTFVSMGQNPDVKKVLEDIIRKTVDKKFRGKKSEVGDLIEKLQESLEDKRYFIVIDDIWEPETWERIQDAFPRNECGSGVITTTRLERVALACCNKQKKYIHYIKPLSNEDSRRLFFRRIFGPEKDCSDTPKKEEISIDILKRCGGMPLAINSIASLLAVDDESTWEYVWKSLGAMTERDEHKRMKQILDLSYIHLPDHLKTCLLYVCMYPEDDEIDKYELLRKWVAEGFVPVSGNSRLSAEDVAAHYFRELINMCMIQPVKIDHYNNEVLSCRVHDIVLDLMRTKSSEENFIHVIDSPKDEVGKIRRVSFHYNDKVDTRISEKNDKGSLLHVRSVLLYQGSRSKPKYLVPRFLELKYIRVLHYEHSVLSLGLDLSGISNLFLLRYLKVACRSPEFLKLPNQIGKLQQLETIDLIGCSPNKYPSDIVSLPWLSYLSSTGYFSGTSRGPLNGTGTTLPNEINRLKSLRTLVGVSVYKNSVETIMGLGELTNLRKLQICLNGINQSGEETINMRMNALHSSICMLSANLTTFSFGQGETNILEPWDTTSTSYLIEKNIEDVQGWSMTPFPQGSLLQELDLFGCIFQRCPEWIGQLHGLTKFTIRVKEVGDGVRIVAGLPSLAYFELVIDIGKEGKEKEENVIISGCGAFKALKHLKFFCKRALLTFEKGAMPKLEMLELVFRYHMAPQFLPVGIQHWPVPTLKRIGLSVASNDMLHMEVEGSQDWKYDDWERYGESAEYRDRIRKHTKKVRPMLKKAFQKHHPDAYIVINYSVVMMKKMKTMWN